MDVGPKSFRLLARSDRCCDFRSAGISVFAGVDWLRNGLGAGGAGESDGLCVTAFPPDLVNRSAGRRFSLASAAKVLLLFVLALLPWTIRNYYTLDGLVFVKSNFGMEFWLGNNPAVKEIYSAERHPAVNQGELLSLVLNGEPNYNRQKAREAMAYIERRPRVFFANMADRFADTWAATYDSRVDPWILALGLSRADVWFCFGFSIVSLAGMIIALAAHWVDALPLAMCLLLFPIPYYVTHSALRYRHPIDPFMTIFAVYGGAQVWRSLTASRGRNMVSQEATKENLRCTPGANTEEPPEFPRFDKS